MHYVARFKPGDKIWYLKKSKNFGDLVEVVPVDIHQVTIAHEVNRGPIVTYYNYNQSVCIEEPEALDSEQAILAIGEQTSRQIKMVVATAKGAGKEENDVPADEIDKY